MVEEEEEEEEEVGDKRNRTILTLPPSLSPSLPPLPHSPLPPSLPPPFLSKEEDGLAILLTLLDEVFDVAAGDKWLQRQLSHVLRQLLRSTLSDKMGRKIIEALHSLASADHVADLLAEFRQSFWPQGYQAASQEQLGTETLLLTALLAHAKLIGSVPGESVPLITSLLSW